ncbi:MAG: tRNA lysidine(34) synthetase TilS [Spirochaetes bacterium]|nr:tRNA lysidine(34) synthetase TilS [Spirochaetota bacterium]
MKSIEKDNPLVSKVRTYLQTVPLPRDATLLVALSGGIDSTALGIALKELSQELEFSLIFGYFNHRLRSFEEERVERSFVSELASILKVPLFIGEAKRGSIESQALQEKRSLEDVAREHRYRFLWRIVKEQKAHFLVTAHTAQDNEETQILRIFQGSSPAGLKGIPSKGKRILRPFLRVTREEIVDFLKERNVQPIEDPSNRNLRFLRNAVRHRLIPLIREVFPGYQTALKRLSIKMNWIEDFLQEELSRRDPWKLTEGGWVCAVDEYLSLPPILRLYSLYRLFNKTQWKKRGRFPFRFLFPLVQGVVKKNERGIWVRGDIRIRIENGKLYWESNIVQEKKKGYLYVLEGKMSITVSDSLRVEVYPLEHSTVAEGGETFNTRGFHTLVLRSRRPGDAIDLQRGRKSVKRLLSELHVPIQYREEVPILQGDDEILAVFLGAYGLPTLRTKSSIKDPVDHTTATLNHITIQIQKMRGGKDCEQPE